MARLRYNGLTTTLGAALSSSATAITFSAALTHSGGTNVPTLGAGDYIPLTLLDSGGTPKEIVHLTAYTSGATSGTISRGQEGTTGQAWSTGDKCTHAPTVEDFRPASDVLWTPGTRSSGDDEFSDGVLDAAWTQVTAGGSVTWTEQADVLSAKYNAQGAAKLACLLKPITIAQGGYIEMAASCQGASASSYGHAALILTNGTAVSSNCVPIFLECAAATVNQVIVWPSSGGAINSAPGAAGSVFAWGRRAFLRLRWQAANTWRAERSIDGVTWIQHGSDISYTMTPTHMGIAVTNWDASTNNALSTFDYFRAA